MKFGSTPLDQAEGAILAHSVKVGARALRKGRTLAAADIAALRAAGKTGVIVARLEPGDVGENEAADRIAAALGHPGVTAAPAFTGRANFYAERAGLCLVDRAAVDRFNLIDEAITVATLEPETVVEPKQMVATIKIIPFAVRAEALDASIATVTGPLFEVAPFKPHRVALVQTTLLGLKDSILDKTVETTRERLEALGSSLRWERRVRHDETELAPVVKEMLAAGADLMLVAGASAILDRRDVIPAAIALLGGTIEQFGMPVDPGNLLLMARVEGVPVLGLPGCARSPKVNGFDWVLRRVLASLPVGPAVIRRMGVGGLLSEIASRPSPRAAAGGPPATAAMPRRPRIAGLVLAAGRSSRMGALNKLLIAIDGKPMVRHAVEAVLGARLSPVVVVTGHERDKVEEVLKDLPIKAFHNKDFLGGLSTSLRVGLAALNEDCDGVLVALGDMPRVTAADVAKLVAAFNPVEGRAIIVPTRHGKRGNPVLWGRQFFAEMRRIGGDIGARALIATHAEAVAEVEMDSDAVLTDIDTPQALARLAASARIDA
ncbi:MAG TPA: molybdopterin-binding/glycosyltransferase family 2 protein [Stellaceae bacterium]|nr:molybdopterin-binding/glycosyltransferase family 2 protein [Stellaceae bacterium]